MSIDRREFLRATLVTAGSLVVGAGCSDDEGGGPSDAGDLGVDADAGPGLLDGAAFFPQSVASGDPKTDSLILWARVEDPAIGGSDVTLELEVALDEAFTQIVQLDGASSLQVAAESRFDHCVKVKVTGLEAGTSYWYRFVHTSDGDRYGSQVGHARTAPAADDDREVRFAFCSCNDYNGRYWNAFAWMAEQDLDFFVHLGDYIYETTGDPLFQAENPDRTSTFTDAANAIVFDEGTDDEFFAAASLDNYRELYRTYRSDPALQRVHERIPMIAIWDDHEYSDDCWGSVATYFDGRQDEDDVERRKNANQAWFEYMPVDYDPDDFVYDPTAEYPNDITIYRDIEYGANVHLVMTDLRTYRPDHLIPEDALPGALAMTQAELDAALGQTPDFALPYVDIDSFDGGSYRTLLVDNAELLGIDPAAVTGNITVEFINAAVTTLNDELQPMDPFVEIDSDTTDTLDRGLAFSQFLKTTQYGILGSRYFVVLDTFSLYGEFLYQATGGASEDIMGPTQQAWFLDRMQSSARTWKIWGNEFCLVQKVVDLRNLGLPDAFRLRLSLSAEDWDGFRNKRDELVEALADVGNVVAITGDIHAFFAATPFSRNDPTKKIVELVGGAISSGTYQELLVSNANANDELREAGAPALAMAADVFMTDPSTRPNPDMAYANIVQHGFGLIAAGPSELICEFHMIDQELVENDLTEDPNLGDNFEVRRYKVNDGEDELYWDDEGTWLRWDPDEYDWVES